MNNVVFCTYFVKNNVALDTTFLDIKSIDTILSSNIQFYYLITLDFVRGGSNGYVFENIILDKIILEQLNNKNCIILLDNSFEGTTCDDYFFTSFINNFIKTYNLTYKNFKILTGNLIENNFNKNINCEFIPYCFFWDRPFFIDKNKENKLNYSTYIDKTEFDKKILCYNGVSRTHRKYLFYKIYNNPLISTNISISLQKDCTNFNYKSQFEISDVENTDINDFFFQHNFNWEIDGLYISNKMDHINLFDIHTITSHFLFLVTESLINNNTLFISEKTFKPIYALRPFIILGNPNILNKIKEMGFKTFDKWWDESYDTESNLTKRINKILNILEFICNKDNNELICMLKEMEEILIHNHNLFMEIKEPKFVEYLKLNGFNKKFKLL
jgi:hypothetical protein